MTHTPLSDYLTCQEVSDWLRIPVGTLAMWRSYGDRGPIWQKHGRRVVYSRADVEAYVAAAREASPARGA